MRSSPFFNSRKIAEVSVDQQTLRHMLLREPSRVSLPCPPRQAERSTIVQFVVSFQYFLGVRVLVPNVHVAADCNHMKFWIGIKHSVLTNESVVPHFVLPVGNLRLPFCNHSMTHPEA